MKVPALNRHNDPQTREKLVAGSKTSPVQMSKNFRPNMFAGRNSSVHLIPSGPAEPLLATISTPLHDEFAPQHILFGVLPSPDFAPLGQHWVSRSSLIAMDLLQMRILHYHR